MHNKEIAEKLKNAQTSVKEAEEKIEKEVKEIETSAIKAANADSGTKAVRQVAALFTIGFFLAVPLATLVTGEGFTINYWVHILVSPCPLVTDYMLLGSLSAVFFNAAMCSLACLIMLYLAPGPLTSGNWAGYFLVIAHAFYGLNFLNMWFSIFGIWVYCLTTKKKFLKNLDIAMMSTAFSPFMSELLWRYPIEIWLPIKIGHFQVNSTGIFLCIVLALFLGFAIPAMLPGAKLLHKGFNLYNGGLAFGLLGLLVYSFMYRTIGITSHGSETADLSVYARYGYSSGFFCNAFFITVFVICIIAGLAKGATFKDYRKLLSESGHNNNFITDYGGPLTILNLGFYGLMMVLYFDLAVTTRRGAGWTGATCGVTLAALSFVASGQHPRNVWPILAGYAMHYFVTLGVCTFFHRTITWSLSTQGYINGLAFATGLCPFAGVYGPIVGILAGAISAVMCTTTSMVHGGFMLYNGGFTAGITALILTPMLAMYLKKRPENPTTNQ